LRGTWGNNEQGQNKAMNQTGHLQQWHCLPLTASMPSFSSFTSLLAF
jgi:hypothetical protein